MSCCNVAITWRMIIPISFILSLKIVLGSACGACLVNPLVGSALLGHAHNRPGSSSRYGGIGTMDAALVGTSNMLGRRMLINHIQRRRRKLKMDAADEDKVGQLDKDDGNTKNTATAADDQRNEEDALSLGMVSAIGFYKQFISPLLPPACRFLPTCSQYGVQAIKEFGPAKGGILTGWRILRCSPFGGKGYDPPRWPPVSYWGTGGL